MPIDEFVFAVSCSATVTDEFELQLTKTGDKARNLMTMFQNMIDRPKTKLKRAFAHSRGSVTKLKTHFLKFNKEMTKMGGKTYHLWDRHASFNNIYLICEDNDEKNY